MSDDAAALDAVRHGFAPEPAHPNELDPDPPLADVAARLVDDLKAVASSEIALLQARAAMAGDGVRRAAMWGAIAGGAALIALLALVFGVILALSPFLGPVLATLIVGAILLLLAGVSAGLARRGARDVQTALAERGDDVHWGETE